MTDSPRLTRNQKVVFDALSASDVPLSAYDILDLRRVRDKGLKAPLTIYRALEKLQDLGLVHRIESLNAFIACDRGPHAEPAGFMSCERCRKTVELPVGECEAALRASARANGFELDRITVEMSGRCTDCIEAG